MNGVLIYSERRTLALELLTFARTLSVPVSVALLGEDSRAWAEDCFAHGAQCAYFGPHPALNDMQADVLASALAQIVTLAETDVILSGSTLRGREVAARLAQKLDAGCITDANGLRYEAGQLIATRYSLGGNTVSTQTITSPRQVIAVMPQTIQATPLEGFNHGEMIEVSLDLKPSPVQVIERRPKPIAGVDVASAEVVVCIGRGVNAPQDLAMVEALAQALGGVIACTRPISHDRHWLHEEQMIGISGKVVKPLLYLGIGLSGQIQHTVGISGAKVIAAINSDKNAPIFQLADYGIVGDLYQIVPKLLERLSTQSP